MHKRFFHLVLLIFLGLTTHAQTVSVPDTNFLFFLKAVYPKTIDQNDHLILSEAAKVQGTFQCNGKNAHSMEGIQYFTNIVELEVNNNALSQLPELGSLTNLTSLDVVNNQLTSLPSLNKLASLTRLLCKGNLLTALPSLDSLPDLQALDVSYNQLTQVPRFPVPNKLQTINLNDNLIATLPDTYPFPNLNKMWLYDNLLTFSELQKLVSVNGYSSLFVPFPQQVVRAGNVFSLKENDPLTLSTRIDQGVAHVTYEWYKNGKLLQSSAQDAFNVPTIQFQDSGRYTCLIKDADFGSSSLSTDTFYVHVRPCVDVNAFSTTVIGMNCQKTGTLKINTASQEPFTYALKSLATGGTILSTSGIFIGLSEPKYVLSIRTGSLCEKKYPYEIDIPKEECKQVLITPNGDGESETYFFSQSGQAKIFDKYGAVIKTLSIPNEWDASSKNGRVPPGIYMADINNGEETIGISVVY